ncbi:MAG: cysteine--tRNA ligase [Clostridiales bacterium]|nr:cysteine--tRNA ligase [Clostridiales bacterium]
MKIYNTMTRKKEEFIPLDKNEVKIYACGPTVYNYIHIGNARPLCVFDVLRRYLEYRGMNVKFVQNFTDVDDKIIKRANEEGLTFEEVSKKYIDEFWIDANSLNFKKASVHPKATENIDEIIDIIKTLEEKGYAYRVDGDVYFRTLKFKDYGKLSHQPIDDLKSGARIAVGEQKEDPLDFALWKSAKPGEPSWDSPWGKGRPGWHIECSAMNRRYLGKTIDIHCGGQDLIFPHHENEIAQSECANGCTFSRYWMHNGYINIDNVKMSKSLGNFKTVREIADAYGYEVIRYFLISSHYRSPINYNLDILEQCHSALDRLYTCRESLDFALKNAKSNPVNTDDENDIISTLNSRRDEFIEAMDDDLNTADGLAAIFELTKDINTKTLDKPVSLKVYETAVDIFDELCGVLGILYNRKSNDIDTEIERLIEERQTARTNKDWATADRTRDELKEMGIILKDTPQGVVWSRE